MGSRAGTVLAAEIWGQEQFLAVERHIHTHLCSEHPSPGVGASGSNLSSAASSAPAQGFAGAGTFGSKTPGAGQQTQAWRQHILKKLLTSLAPTATATCSSTPTPHPGPPPPHLYLHPHLHPSPSPSPTPTTITTSTPTPPQTPYPDLASAPAGKSL
ncbi:hypothetical protein MC885_011007 [Smutsia gigantea]|nr:hypothetical protein MC885_011007 [Smutsia gigantea]